MSCMVDWAMRWTSVALLVVAISACTEPSGTSPEELAVPESTTDGSIPQREGEVIVGLPAVDVEVTNAVAPFDHESNVDSVLTDMAIGQAAAEFVSQCLERSGFTSNVAVSPLPDRTDPVLMANSSFPDTERLAREGLPNLPETPGSPEDFQGPSAAEQEASAACAEELVGSPVDRATEGYGFLRSAWEEVLAEIETIEEIQSLLGAFSECLRDAGIPAEYTTSEGTFFGYVDFLLFESSTDEEIASIRERHGMLYAECGRELFEAREELRGGERRSEFLREHEAAIEELNEYLFGAG